MKNDIRATIGKLREIAPKLNEADDMAWRNFKEVDDVLAKLSLGIRTYSEPFLDKLTFVDGQQHRTIYRLAYGRVNGQYHLHIEQVNFAGAVIEPNAIVGSDVLPIREAPRDWRLAAFSKLPSLLDDLFKRAMGMTEAATDASAMAKEIATALQETTVPAEPKTERPIRLRGGRTKKA